MAKKNSFVMYDNWREFFLPLSDEQAGKLIKAIFRYRESNIPESPEEPLITIPFNFIVTQLVYDEKKYNEKCENMRRKKEKPGQEKKPGFAFQDAFARKQYESE